jgi:hypothetical protein
VNHLPSKPPSQMSDAIKLTLLSALANGFITWGVVSTKLEWLRRDVDRLDTRVSLVETRNMAVDASARQNIK